MMLLWHSHKHLFRGKWQLDIAKGHSSPWSQWCLKFKIKDKTKGMREVEEEREEKAIGSRKRKGWESRRERKVEKEKKKIFQENSLTSTQWMQTEDEWTHLGSMESSEQISVFWIAPVVLLSVYHLQASIVAMDWVCCKTDTSETAASLSASSVPGTLPGTLLHCLIHALQ